MHPKNKTKYKTLDKLAANPRIVEIWDEGTDGLWVTLANGYNFEGCSGLHGYTCKQLFDLAKEIETGNSY